MRQRVTQISGGQASRQKEQQMQGPKAGACLARSSMSGVHKQGASGQEERVEREGGGQICRALGAKLSQGLGSDVSNTGRAGRL